MNPKAGHRTALLDEAGIGDAPDGFCRELLDAAPDAMIVVGADGRIVIANALAERMFGYTREQMLGQAIEVLLPERFRALHAKQRREYANEPRRRVMGTGLELTALRRDGTEFPVEIGLGPIEVASGTLVVSAIRDVTERRRMVGELEAARQAAERANKANTAFLSAASHDLRQPVQALRLLNGALRRTVNDPLVLEMLESQQESLDALTDLLHSLLEISRIDAGGREPDVKDAPCGPRQDPPPEAAFVLIVEDDAQVAKAWDRLLRSEGYRVAGAGTIPELTTLLNGLDRVPDLVLSDYHLQDGANGVQAVQAVRETTGTCMPAFILTGDPSMIVEEAGKLDNTRILGKPIGPEALLRLARAAIEDGSSGRTA